MHRKKAATGDEGLSVFSVRWSASPDKHIRDEWTQGIVQRRLVLDECNEFSLNELFVADWVIPACDGEAWA